MTLLRGANLGLRFALELTSLAALCAWGLGTTSGPLRFVAAIGAPLAAAVAWGLLVAPKARHDRGPLLRVVVEVVVLGAGPVALAASGHERLAAVTGIVVVVHLVLYHLTEPTATSRPRERS